VDGVNYVKKIALNADMEVELVKKALQHLIYYGCVVMVTDIFQMTNQYTVTKNIVHLYHNVAMQRACLDLIRLPRAHPPATTTSSQDTNHHTAAPPPLTIGLVLRWYSALRPGYSLSAFVRDYGADLSAHHINVHAFIIFGLANHIIRRLHKYPLTLKTNSPSTLFSSGNTSLSSTESFSNASTSSIPQTTSTTATPSLSSRPSTVIIPNLQQFVLSRISSFD
jgi:hypothetical protein